jgi:hypothetical protein
MSRSFFGALLFPSVTQSTQSIFPLSATPTTTGANDQGYELGMKFSSAKAGNIISILFYKDALETGTHTGKIWSIGGSLLTTVIFSGETSSGWQKQDLVAPFSISASTTYVVSVNANAAYVITIAGFNASITSGDLTAPIGAGVFDGVPGTFPNALFANGNYYRDIAFIPT